MRIFVVIGLPIQQKMRIVRVRISVKCNGGFRTGKLDVHHLSTESKDIDLEIFGTANWIGSCGRF